VLVTGPDSIFWKLGNAVITFKKDDRAARVNRFSTVLFKFFYFTSITVWGWMVLADQPWTPSILLGRGNVGDTWHKYPFNHVSWAVKRYYLIQLGYHIHDLLFHCFWAERRNDFLEMLLHHVITLFLVGLSYIMNYLKIGTLVMLLHDMSDVFVYASKALVDTKYVVLTLIAYLGLLIFWAFGRLYVYPFWVLHNAWYEGYPLIHGAAYFFFPAVFSLLALHVYWYFLFLQMGLHFVSKGETVDLQQKINQKEKFGRKTSPGVGKPNSTANGNGHAGEINGNGSHASKRD